MKIKGLLRGRREKKARLQHERERQLRQALEGRDPEEAVRDAVRGIGPGVGTPHGT